jgi:hypothetical protein
MNQNKHEIHDILLGKISRLCSKSYNIPIVYLLCKRMKCGLWMIATYAIANYGTSSITFEVTSVASNLAHGRV